MKREVRDLCIQALQDDGKAYWKLGMLFFQGGILEKDKELSRLCFQKAMELGSEEGFLHYHELFSKGEEVLDDKVYREMSEDFRTCKSDIGKERLRRYLELGTERQRRENFIE